VQEEASRARKPYIATRILPNVKVILPLPIDRAGERRIELEAIEAIKNRCEASGIDYEEIEREWNFLWDEGGEQEIIEHFDEETGGATVLRIEIPRGRETYSVFIQQGFCAEWVLNEPFEDFKKLKGYEASWSPKHRVIECNLVPCDPEQAIRTLSKRRYTNPGSQPLSGSEGRVVFESSASYSVSIGDCSNVHAILENYVVEAGLFPEEIESEDDPQVRVKRSLTLRIEGIEVTHLTHGLEIVASLATLEKLPGQL